MLQVLTLLAVATNCTDFIESGSPPVVCFTCNWGILSSPKAFSCHQQAWCCLLLVCGGTGLSWVRDGVNLRLEIGICSLGPPDSNDLAAAAAAAAANSSHNHAHAHHDHEDRQQGGLGHIADHCEDQCSSECSHQSKRQRTEKLDPTQQQQQLQQQWPEKRLEIIAASPVPAHAEVHNTYGEHSNAELVHKYGFCLPQNPFDEVQLAPSWSWLLLEVGRLDHDRRFEEHIQWLQQHR